MADSNKQGGVSPTDVADWVDLHGDALLRYALRRVGDRETAEDLVQETFLAAVGGGASFEGDASPRTWLIGILKHKIVDHVRKASRQWPADHDLEDPEMDRRFRANGSWARPPANWAPHPEDLLEQEEFWRTLEQCLEHLPRRQREAFSLREMEQISTEEICKTLGVRPPNLWVMLHRARARMRTCLERRWFEQESDGA